MKTLTRVLTGLAIALFVAGTLVVAQRVGLLIAGFIFLFLALLIELMTTHRARRPRAVADRLVDHAGTITITSGQVSVLDNWLQRRVTTIPVPNGEYQLGVLLRAHDRAVCRVMLTRDSHCSSIPVEATYTVPVDTGFVIIADSHSLRTTGTEAELRTKILAMIDASPPHNDWLLLSSAANNYGVVAAAPDGDGLYEIILRTDANGQTELRLRFDEPAP